MNFSRSKNLLIAGVLALSFAQLATAKTYSVGPCDAKGGDSRMAEVLCDLAQDTIVNLGHQVTDKKTGNDGLVKLKALKLGEAYVVTANLTIDDKIVSSSKLKASSADEFDSIVPRLVRAIVDQEDVKKDTKVGEVSDDEQQFRKKRLTAKRESIIGFGGAGVANVDATRPYYNLIFGGSVDWTKFRLAGTIDFAWHAGERSGYFTTLAFTGNFFLNDDQSAPYVGPRVGIAWVERSHGPNSSYSLPDPASVFLMGAVAGWEFYRNYEASFGLELGIDYAFKDVGSGGNAMLFALRGVVHR